MSLSCLVLAPGTCLPAVSILSPHTDLGIGSEPRSLPRLTSLTSMGSSSPPTPHSDICTHNTLFLLPGTLFPRYDHSSFLPPVGPLLTGIFGSFDHSFFFFSCWAACGILVPWPEIEPAPPALEGQNLNHWTARKPRLLSHFISIR